MRKRFSKGEHVIELSWFVDQSLIVKRTASEVEFEDGGWEAGEETWDALAQDALEDGYELVSESPVARDDLSAAWIQARYPITSLPKRLEAFYDSGEYKRHLGMRVRGLPMWSDDVAFAVQFDDGLLPFVAKLYPDHADADAERYLPLSTLSHESVETSEFIAVDTTVPACPVSMWYHGSATYYPVSDSLDEFLESLEDEE